jgi:thiol-disulfide isomerase/thioredoxin
MNFKKLTKLIQIKKWTIVHTLIASMLVLILGCATFCPHCCVFLPNVLNYREGFDNPNADENKRQKAVLAMFYAPWCGHCKKAKPEWEKVMQTNQHRMTMIDCTTEDGKVIAEKHGISGFPTIRWFQNGLDDVKNYVEYSGDRVAKGFQSFLNTNDN